MVLNVVIENNITYNHYAVYTVRWNCSIDDDCMAQSKMFCFGMQGMGCI